MNIASEPVDPTVEMMLRMMAADLTDREIARGLHGSLGFFEDVMTYTIKLFNLGDMIELPDFAKDWVGRNPLPQQGIVQAAAPHKYLAPFYVYQSRDIGAGIHYHSGQHKLLFGPSDVGKDAVQRNLLEQYATEIARQNAAFNFTGGSALDGRPLPGWDRLKESFPRRLLIGIRTSPEPFWIEMSYTVEDPLHPPEMVEGMFAWLNAQFEHYSHGFVDKQPTGNPPLIVNVFGPHR